MDIKLEDLNGIGPVTAKKMKNAGIDTIEKLAKVEINDLIKVGGIQKNSAEKYVETAKTLIETKNYRHNPRKHSSHNSHVSNFHKSHKKSRGHIEKKKKESVKDTWFPLEYMQQIRFYHHKTKQLEMDLERNKIDFDIDELMQFKKYVKLLNVNYKNQSQIKIFKELELTPQFYDPLEKKEIRIWDIMFECARALWFQARLYKEFSKKFEEENNLNRSIVAMVECSKAYKTASLFARACTRQEEFGPSLNPDTLEFSSETARIKAQSMVAMREELNRNFYYASKLYSGLSVLSQRLLYIKKYNDKKKENKVKAQYFYDMGKACALKAKATKTSKIYNAQGTRKTLQEKANFYFYQAENIWENLLENADNLTKEEREDLRINLSIVNENIMQHDVEIIDEYVSLKIQDPEPIIIIPENLAYMIPRTTEYLTNYPTRNLEYKRYKNYQDFKRETDLRLNKLEKLNSKKAGIGRTIKELKTLYKNNDIDVNKFSALLEKYSTKFKMIEKSISKLESIYKEDTNNNKKKGVSHKEVVASH